MSSIDNDTETGFSWRRVAGQSFALALHAGAFMFLIAPVATRHSARVVGTPK